MREAFTFLYSRLFIESMLVLGIVSLVIGRLRRRLRVSPVQTNHAPVLWLVNFTADARLHRRLRRLASDTAAATASGPVRRRNQGRSKTKRLAEDLYATIIGLDERLIESTSMDFDQQKREVRAIRADADRIDDLLGRLTKVMQREGEDLSVQPMEETLDDVAARLEAIEARLSSSDAKVIETTGAPRQTLQLQDPTDPVDTAESAV